MNQCMAKWCGRSFAIDVRLMFPASDFLLTETAKELNSPITDLASTVGDGTADEVIAEWPASRRLLQRVWPVPKALNDKTVRLRPKIPVL